MVDMLIAPGDKVVCGVHGLFGERMADALGRAGAEVVRVEGEWGRAIPLERLIDAWSGDCRALFVVHGETSTGVAQPLDGLADAVRADGGLFLLDWTFGVVHFVTLQRQGSSYIALAPGGKGRGGGKSEVFLRSVGDNGFAPTAAAVHPLTGDLYIAIGGRGTRGAVYRIRYTAGIRKGKPTETAKLQPVPRSLAWRAGPRDAQSSFANDDRDSAARC